jgi:hypothetical protein
MLVERTASRLPILMSWNKTGDGVEEMCHSDTRMPKHPATM